MDTDTRIDIMPDEIDGDSKRGHDDLITEIEELEDRRAAQLLWMNTIADG